MIVGVIIATSTTVVFMYNQHSSEESISAPTLPPNVRLQTIIELISENYNEESESLEKALEDPTSSQAQALQWIALEDACQVHVDHTTHLLQRYALAVLYYETGGKNWTDQYEFLKATHECTWSGALQCDEIAGEFITGSDLTEN